MKQDGFVPLWSVLDVYLQGDIGDVIVTDQPSMQSGYQALDVILGGINEPDLIVLGGQTGSGKSSFALNLCVNAAKTGRVCGIFSLEMTRKQVAMQILAAESGVDSSRLRLGLLSVKEERKAASVVDTVTRLPIYLNDSSSTSISEMASSAHQLKTEHGLDLLVVDSLDKIFGGEKSAQLKLIARDLEVAILACAATEEGDDNGSNQRPRLSGLKDAGAEEHADVVMFIYREDRNFTEEEWEQHAPGRPYPRNIAELIVAKHRHGPTGSLHLYFRDTLMRFDELMRYEESVA